MRKVILIISLLTFALASFSIERTDSVAPWHRYDSIYQGIFIRLDLLMPIVEAGRSSWQMQNYEMAASVRLKDRFYPTLEGGYAFGKWDRDNSGYVGKGGFMRVGMDFNGLRKSAKGKSAFLVGVRLGTAFQQYDLTDLTEYSIEDLTLLSRHHHSCHRADVWGEVLIGCNVHIAGDFYMGWAGRLKFLMTRKQKGDTPLPTYIPGYGTWNETGWGVNYYISWRF